MLLLHREIDKLFHCYMHTTVHVQKRKILMKAKFVNEIENVLKNYIFQGENSSLFIDICCGLVLCWTRGPLDRKKELVKKIQMKFEDKVVDDTAKLIIIIAKLTIIITNTMHIDTHILNGK